MQTDVGLLCECEKISDYFSIHVICEFTAKVLDTFNTNFAVGNVQLSVCQRMQLPASTFSTNDAD